MGSAFVIWELRTGVSQHSHILELLPVLSRGSGGRAQSRFYPTQPLQHPLFESASGPEVRRAEASGKEPCVSGVGRKALLGESDHTAMSRPVVLGQNRCATSTFEHVIDT